MSIKFNGFVTPTFPTVDLKDIPGGTTFEGTIRCSVSGEDIDKTGLWLQIWGGAEHKTVLLHPASNYKGHHTFIDKQTRKVHNYRPVNIRIEEVK